MDLAGAKSGNGAVSASVDELTKAYEALLSLGFQNQQIQEAMQVSGSVSDAPAAEQGYYMSRLEAILYSGALFIDKTAIGRITNERQACFHRGS